MDRQTTSDGKPYGPIRYEQLVDERYYITKFTHTSYADTGQMTPKEREQIIKRIAQELKIQDENNKKMAEKIRK